MNGIFKVANNPFDSVLISDARLSNFADDAQSKLRAEYPDFAAAIARAQQNLSALLGKVSVDDAGKQENTEGVDVFLVDLAKYMVDAEAQVRVSLKKGSAAYNAIYPDNLQTYTRLNKTNAPAVLDALKKVMEESGAALPAEMKARMAGFRAAWDDARAVQNTSEGTLSGSRSGRDASRADLEDALFDCLLALARTHYKTPAKLRAFFDHNLLGAPRHSSLEQPSVTPIS